MPVERNRTSAKGPGWMKRKPLEVWGGLECTIARIRDDYRNQSVETGHHDRIDDLDRIAALGLRTLRYPALLEARPSRGSATTAAARTTPTCSTPHGPSFSRAMPVTLPNAIPTSISTR